MGCHGILGSQTWILTTPEKPALADGPHWSQISQCFQRLSALEVLKLGSISITAEGLGVLVALMTGMVVACLRAKKYGFTVLQVVECLSWAYLVAISGAKAADFLVNLGRFSLHFEDARSFITSGYMLYGGLIGGVGTVILWLKRERHPVAPFLDLIAPAMAFSQGVGKIGCYFNGCCYGKPVAWGVMLPGLNDGVCRHPTQLAVGMGRVPSSGSPGELYWRFTNTTIGDLAVPYEDVQ
jgi:prolipoprotein diacylglyceryltransferase